MGDKLPYAKSLAVEDAIYAFQPRIGDFGHIVGNLYLGFPYSVAVNGGEFVHTSECRVAFGGYEPFADTENVDTSTLR